jgi:glucuronosyltransferase
MERWVSESSPHGTIVVSMGSSVQSVPAAVRRVFMQAFSRLPYRFIWKLEQAKNTSAYPERVPTNVKLVNWLPQQDLLGKCFRIM